MKLWQEGYPNAVALSGVALSGEHIKMIAELSPKSIIVMLDGDNAGRRASLKIAEKLKNTFDVRIASPAEGTDPKMLGRADFKMLIRNANKVENFLA
jgi:DNA primase